ncbi:cation:proton antiporter [Actinoallomurus acanthiterrae]
MHNERRSALMDGVESYGLVILAVALVGLAAVLSSRISERLRVPAPAFFLIGAAVVSDLWPRLGGLSFTTVEHVVTIALAVILFDGGMHIGWRRFRTVAAGTVWVGVAGTLVTAGAVAVAAHTMFGFDWRVGLLLGTALAPTDPAVVFSVLGRREIIGRSGVLLEGESGANDPVGIALLVALLGATGTGLDAVGDVAWEFTLQMTVGVAVGAAGGLALLWFMRRVPLPSEGLYSLRVLASALAVYGIATVAHGSGFLAVFVAGILIGDERAPYKREITGFHSSLASLAEIVAFVMLGLTIRLRDLPDGQAWLIGLALAMLLAFVIRPVLVGLVLWPVRLRLGERAFVLWTGLKGAVPILLGAFVVQSGVKEAPRVYDIIFVVVVFSVIVQGGMVPFLARRLKVPLRTIEPEPWTLGVRFQHEPQGLHRFQVTTESPAAGRTIEDLPLDQDTWISFIIRDGHLVPIQARTRLQTGDEVVVLSGDETDLTGLFTR